jgi:hypothetical protein
MAVNAFSSSSLKHLARKAAKSVAAVIFKDEERPARLVGQQWPGNDLYNHSNMALMHALPFTE